MARNSLSKVGGGIQHREQGVAELHGIDPDRGVEAGPARLLAFSLADEIPVIEIQRRPDPRIKYPDIGGGIEFEDLGAGPTENQIG